MWLVTGFQRDFWKRALTAVLPPASPFAIDWNRDRVGLCWIKIWSKCFSQVCRSALLTRCLSASLKEARVVSPCLVSARMRGGGHGVCWVLEWSGLGTLGAGVVAGVRMSGTALAAAASMAMPPVQTEDKLMRQMHFKKLSSYR